MWGGGAELGGVAGVAHFITGHEPSSLVYFLLPKDKHLTAEQMHSLFLSPNNESHNAGGKVSL